MTEVVTLFNVSLVAALGFAIIAGVLDALQERGFSHSLQRFDEFILGISTIALTICFLIEAEGSLFWHIVVALLGGVVSFVAMLMLSMVSSWLIKSVLSR